MIENFKTSLKETTISVIPICILVTITSILLGIDYNTIISFIISSFLLILGITTFTFGSNISMMIIGEKIGNKIIKNQNITLILISVLVIGFTITIVEPDLKILATQLTNIPDIILISTVGLGVGLFLMLATIKILFKLNLKTIIIINYIIIFTACIFLPNEFIPIAFDSSGVTTGLISVPFILTLGIGLTSSRTDKDTKSDTFGLIGLCSIGPIITVLLLGLLYDGNQTYDTNIFTNNLPLINQYINNFIKSIQDVLIPMIPIVLVFIIFKLVSKNSFTKKETKKIILGLIITLLGLAIFLVSVNVSFMKTGYLIGEKFTELNNESLTILFGIIIGFLIILVEPAVKILNEQIEEITNGSISKNIMQISLSVGGSIAVILSLLRLFYNISILYILLFGYLLVIILSFITPKVFTAIAFDSGGSATGSLTTTFLLPFIIGICTALEKNIFTDAFGLIAIMGMTPLITIQILGIIFQFKTKQKIYKNIDETIIDYDWRKSI